MDGVGPTLGPQIMTEIGNMTRFTHRGAQGKPYYVYRTVGANKFLRIYYGRIKEYLSTLTKTEGT